MYANITYIVKPKGIWYSFDFVITESVSHCSTNFFILLHKQMVFLKLKRSLKNWVRTFSVVRCSHMKNLAGVCPSQTRSQQQERSWDILCHLGWRPLARKVTEFQENVRNPVHVWKWLLSYSWPASQYELQVVFTVFLISLWIFDSFRKQSVREYTTICV